MLGEVPARDEIREKITRAQRSTRGSSRKRRKVEQEKNEAARTGDACRSESMEETREKRPAEEEVERDNKRSRSTNNETGSGWFGRRGDR